MNKIDIGAKPFMYPMPVTLVGANVGDEPNYLVAAYVGMVNSRPPMISVALSKSHYTNLGIREHGTFSVNIPSEEMVTATDYCGLVSGHKVDKSRIFETFYGKLESAPMIKECPLSLECKVVQTLQLAVDEVFIGEIVAAYCEERYLTDGQPDIKKIRPFVFSTQDGNYWKVGDHLGKAWEVGKALKDQGTP